jgi:hypothetical protein
VLIIVGTLTLILAFSPRNDLDENILVNGHSRERLLDLVRVATDDDQPSPKDSDADSDEGAQRDSDILPRTSCRYCYQLTLEGMGYTEIIETKAYHLKYLCVFVLRFPCLYSSYTDFHFFFSCRHGKELTDDAFESTENLVEEYGQKYVDRSLFPYPFFDFFP